MNLNLLTSSHNTVGWIKKKTGNNFHAQRKMIKCNCLLGIQEIKLEKNWNKKWLWPIIIRFQWYYVVHENS